jgi:hypothetical protein
MAIPTFEISDEAAMLLGRLLHHLIGVELEVKRIARLHGERGRVDFADAVRRVRQLSEFGKASGALDVLRLVRNAVAHDLADHHTDYDEEVEDLVHSMTFLPEQIIGSNGAKTDKLDARVRSVFHGAPITSADLAQLTDLAWECHM